LKICVLCLVRIHCRKDAARSDMEYSLRAFVRLSLCGLSALRSFEMRHESCGADLRRARQ
jgi:hypothetical protein